VITYKLVFSQQSMRDLWKLEDDLSVAASSAIAARYVDAIVDFCASLSESPHRGERRVHIRKDLRTVGFRNRVSIHFQVREHDSTVIIARIMYAGRTH
jgi:toxin ParE1/3/4